MAGLGLGAAGRAGGIAQSLDDLFLQKLQQAQFAEQQRAALVREAQAQQAMELNSQLRRDQLAENERLHREVEADRSANRDARYAANIPAGAEVTPLQHERVKDYLPFSLKPIQVAAPPSSIARDDQGGATVPLEGTIANSPEPEGQRYIRELTEPERFARAKEAADAAKEQGSLNREIARDKGTAEYQRQMAAAAMLRAERGPAERPPTQSQELAGIYGGRMVQAEPTISTAQADIAKRNPVMFEAQMFIDQPSLQDKALQGYIQASRNFINATLRRESGMAISQSEMRDARRQYIPWPGDQPETLALKQANREYIAAANIKNAGKSYLPPPEPIIHLDDHGKPVGATSATVKPRKIATASRTPSAQLGTGASEVRTYLDENGHPIRR